MDLDKRLIIYDNGGKTFDRITALDNKDRFKRNGETFYSGIGASETGYGFYLHIEAQRGRHLGKRVTFEELTPELQEKLINEFKN